MVLLCPLIFKSEALKRVPWKFFGYRQGWYTEGLYCRATGWPAGILGEMSTFQYLQLLVWLICFTEGSYNLLLGRYDSGCQSWSGKEDSKSLTVHYEADLIHPPPPTLSPTLFFPWCLMPLIWNLSDSFFPGQKPYFLQRWEKICLLHGVEVKF